MFVYPYLSTLSEIENMADQSDHDATLKEIEELLNDESFCRMVEPRNETACR
jgi:hypothetical protein